MEAYLCSKTAYSITNHFKQTMERNSINPTQTIKKHSPNHNDLGNVSYN